MVILKNIFHLISEHLVTGYQTLIIIIYTTMTFPVRASIGEEEKTISLPGQACVSQTIDWNDGPWQFLPPLDGAGLSHFRLLYLKPPPQLTVHFPYIPHWDHSPSTKYENMMYFMNLWKLVPFWDKMYYTPVTVLKALDFFSSDPFGGAGMSHPPPPPPPPNVLYIF